MTSEPLEPGWKRLPIGEVADLRWGDTSTTKASYVERGYPAYSASGQDGFLPHADFDRTGVVLSAIGADCGRTWLATGKWSCIKNTIRFWAIDPQVRTEYLYWATRDKRFWPRRGSAQPFISQTDARSVDVDLPPLPIQDQVVETLGALDDRIDLLRQTNTTLEAIAQALFKSWFVDFDPVHAKAEGREPEAMDAATTALFPSEFEASELGPIPKGWRTIPFGKLLRQSVGGDWGKEASDAEYVSKMAIVRGTDIPDLKSSSPLRVPVRFTTPRKLSSRALTSGDLVIEVSGGSKGQPTGRSIYVTQALLDLFDCPVVPASFCRRFCPISREIGLLLAEHLSYIYAAGRTWDYQNQSTGISNFQTKYFLSNELVVIPTDEVLSAFIRTIAPIAERTKLYQSRRLADLRDTLLPRLISGKLRLPEATEAAEEALA